MTIWQVSEEQWTKALKATSIGDTAGLKTHDRSLADLRISDINFALKDERVRWLPFDMIYVEMLRNNMVFGRTFPPVHVINRGDKGLRLRDGFHRIEAARWLDPDAQFPSIIWTPKGSGIPIIGKVTNGRGH